MCIYYIIKAAFKFNVKTGYNKWFWQKIKVKMDNKSMNQYATGGNENANVTGYHILPIRRTNFKTIVASLFTIAKIWKQPECQWMNG